MGTWININTQKKNLSDVREETDFFLDPETAPTKCIDSSWHRQIKQLTFAF